MKSVCIPDPNRDHLEHVLALPAAAQIDALRRMLESDLAAAKQGGTNGHA